MAMLLSAAAGSADAIGYLGLGGIFLSFVSGNIVLLAAHIAAGDPESRIRLLAVPVFIAGLAGTKVIADWLTSRGVRTLRPLLLIELVLLVAACVCVALGAGPTVAGMLGVTAMAVQSALGQVSELGGSSTVAMTTNIATLVVDVGDAVLGHHRDPRVGVGARQRIGNGLARIAGFTVGCGAGAVAETAIGARALVLPAVLVLVVLGVAGKRAERIVA